MKLTLMRKKTYITFSKKISAIKSKSDKYRKYSTIYIIKVKAFSFIFAGYLLTAMDTSGWDIHFFPLSPFSAFTLTLRHTVGDNIRCLRGLLHLTQTQLAENTGLSLDFLGRLERGSANVGIDNLNKIASALNIEPQYLLTHGYCFKRLETIKINFGGKDINSPIIAGAVFSEAHNRIS
jgi:hypothetical protein